MRKVEIIPYSVPPFESRIPQLRQGLGLIHTSPDKPQQDGKGTWQPFKDRQSP